MFATYLVLLTVGLGTIWAGLRIAEEVYRIALVATGLICLAWGFTLSPDPVQLFIEILLGTYMLVSYKWSQRPKSKPAGAMLKVAVSKDD